MGYPNYQQYAQQQNPYGQQQPNNYGQQQQQGVRKILMFSISSYVCYFFIMQEICKE